MFKENRSVKFADFEKDIHGSIEYRKFNVGLKAMKEGYASNVGYTREKFEEDYDNYKKFLDEEYKDEAVTGFWSNWVVNRKFLEGILADFDLIKAEYEAVIAGLESQRAAETSEVTASTVDELKGVAPAEKLLLASQEKDFEKSISGITSSVSNVYKDDVRSSWHEEFEIDDSDKEVSDFNTLYTELLIGGLLSSYVMRGDSKGLEATKKELHFIAAHYGKNGKLTYDSIIKYLGKSKTNQDLSGTAHALVRKRRLFDTGHAFILGHILGSVLEARKTLSDGDAKSYERYVDTSLDKISNELNPYLKIVTSTPLGHKDLAIKRAFQIVHSNVLTSENWKKMEDVRKAEEAKAKEAELAAEKEKQRKDVGDYYKTVSGFASELFIHGGVVKNEFEKTDAYKKTLQLLTDFNQSKGPITFEKAVLEAEFIKTGEECLKALKEDYDKRLLEFYEKVLKESGTPVSATSIDMGLLKNPMVVAKLKDLGIDADKFTKDFEEANEELKAGSTVILDVSGLSEESKRLVPVSKVLKYESKFAAKKPVPVAQSQPGSSESPDSGAVASGQGKSVVIDTTSPGSSGSALVGSAEKPGSGKKSAETPAKKKEVARKQIDKTKFKKNPKEYCKIDSPEEASYYGKLEFKNKTAENAITLGDIMRSGMLNPFLFEKADETFIKASIKGGTKGFIAKWNGKEFYYEDGPNKGERVKVWNRTRIEKPNEYDFEISAQKEKIYNKPTKKLESEKQYKEGYTELRAQIEGYFKELRGLATEEQQTPDTIKNAKKILKTLGRLGREEFLFQDSFVQEHRKNHGDSPGTFVVARLDTLDGGTISRGFDMAEGWDQSYINMILEGVLGRKAKGIMKEWGV